MTEHSAAELRPLAMPGLAVIRIGRVIGSGRGSPPDQGSNASGPQVLRFAKLAVTFATSFKLGVPSLRYRTSHRLAAGSAFGEPRSK